MMAEDGGAALRDRKSEHLRLAAGPDVGHVRGTGLDGVRLVHRALPERALASVSLETELIGHRLEAPLVVAAMTGGTRDAVTVNARLLRGAAEHGIGLTLGSGRRLLDDPELVDTYRPSGSARPPLLLANLGAAQLRDSRGVAEAERLVELLGADGLSIHLNALQEALQPEGETDFAGVLDGIAATVTRLAPRPVVVKEVGFGLSAVDVTALAAAGVTAVDVAGAGGTNWALVEGRRDARAAAVGAAFADWGLATGEAIVDARTAAPQLPIIASGGLRDGVEVAKCLALGATAGGLARELLLAARADRVAETLDAVIAQLRIASWLAGASASRTLGTEHLR